MTAAISPHKARAKAALETRVQTRIASLCAALTEELAPHRDDVLVFDAATHRLTSAGPTGRARETERAITVADALATITAEAEAIGVHTVAAIWARVHSPLVPGALRGAVLAREDLATRWPWDEDHDASALLAGLLWRLEMVRAIRGDADALARAVDPETPWRWEPKPYGWPADVATRTVADWAAPILKHEREGLAQFRALGEAGEWGRIAAPWRALAVLYAVIQSVEQARQTPVIRHPASKEGRAALAVIAAGPGAKRGKDPAFPTLRHPWRPEMQLTDRDHVVELVWDGRRTPVQLRLGLDDERARSLNYATLCGILRELHEDGLRDWLILHRMAGEQGATGTIRWTWDDHKARTPYPRRVALGKISDADLAAATGQRLWQLKRAEIRLYAPQALPDGSTPWVRVGPWGLLDIPAGIRDPEGRDRLVVVKLNPAIYASAKRGAAAPNFLLLEESALYLPGPALRLRTLIACDWQYERQADGIVRTAGTLWEYASISHGRRTERKRWPEAERALERLLSTLAEKGHLGDWRAIGGEGADRQYLLRPPQWWVDQVILAVPPAFGKSLAETPKTGAELKAWRERKGWSHAELATRASVGRITLIRAEATPTKALSPYLVGQLRPL